ncbi:probable tyrosyl-DNA phosphodiesterase isoform X2 [Bicyclus anynana]|uniref:Probable tyrosyl-DNA phosphodiesterase isoform X2 n=1 Tax=Bicyclus anynana TaxID=110368 RepID=A0ABM3LWV6_BICAN|nr:probable tyrosyl-DNA phosphodiesterase isoform X2 [Bicyclus anynana]
MNRSNKRMSRMDGPELKRVRKECSYGVACYRLNPAHLREYSHPHLEAILDEWDGNGSFPIPEQMSLQRSLLTDQLNILLEKKLYEPGAADNAERAPAAAGEPLRAGGGAAGEPLRAGGGAAVEPLRAGGGAAGEPLRAGGGAAGEALRAGDSTQRSDSNDSEKNTLKSDKAIAGTSREKSESPAPGLGARIRDPEYRPVVPPTRRAEAYLPVVRPRGLMRAKHEAAAPHHVFYTAISAAPRTHAQPYSVTFLELLDESLGELRSSLQLNFMVEPGWLLAQYYFAGYSAKKLTILYGEECDDMRQLAGKPHVDAVRVRMATPFGKHHTKLMLLCYEDGSLRVVVSTANLYHDDWDNRTQGLWLSPRCAPLPAAAPAHAGEARTRFKRDLLRYLAHYRLPQLAHYVERVQRCDFSAVNVFLVASVPGSHRDLEWGLARVGALLRQHCAVPPAAGRAWPLVAQASSLGSYGPDPKLWLCGEFLQQFSASAGTPPPLAPPPPLQLLYPSLPSGARRRRGARARCRTSSRTCARATRGPPSTCSRRPTSARRRGARAPSGTTRCACSATRPACCCCRASRSTRTSSPWRREPRSAWSSRTTCRPPSTRPT